MKHNIPEDAKCVVCGQPHPTDFVQTERGNLVYFHLKCFIEELPKDTVKRIWREL